MNEAIGEEAGDMAPSVEEIASEILAMDSGIVFSSNWGERALFYNPNWALKKGIYVATFKERDGANDRSSFLDKGRRFRFNVGLTKASYITFFGPPPKRPDAGQTVDTGHDFTLCDTILPHPIYAWMSWIAVINPTRATMAVLEPLLLESIQLAHVKFAKRV
jgi:Family of unknown function (DUF6194)